MTILCLCILVIILWYISRNNPLYKVIDDFTNQHIWITIAVTIIWSIISITFICFNYHIIGVVTIIFFFTMMFINVASHDVPIIGKLQIGYSAYSAYILSRGLFNEHFDGKNSGLIFILISLGIMIAILSGAFMKHNYYKNHEDIDNENKENGNMFSKHSWLYYWCLRPFKSMIKKCYDIQQIGNNRVHEINRKRYYTQRIKNIEKSKINKAIDKKLYVKGNSKNSDSYNNTLMGSATNKYADSLISDAISSLSNETNSSKSNSTNDK